MKQKNFIAILTSVIIILCAIGIFVGIKIVDLVKERIAIKDHVSDIAETGAQTNEELSGLVEIPTEETFNTDEMTFVEEITNGIGDKVKVYKDKDGNEFTFSEDGRLIRTMSRPGAMGKDVAMDVEALLNVARAYMIDTYGADFEPFAYTAIHSNMTTDGHKSYIIEYRNATEDQFYFVCIYDNGVLLWSQFSDTSDVQIVE